MTSADLLKELKDNGGFTFEYYDTKLTEEKGYFVAKPEFQLVVPEKAMDTSVISQFIATNVFTLLHSDNVFVGGWWNPKDRQYYLDIVEKYDSKEYAIRIGMMRDQKSIFDAHTGKAIFLPERQKTGTLTQQNAYINLKIRELTGVD